MEFRLLGDCALILCYGIHGNDRNYEKIRHDYNIIRQQLTDGIIDIVLCYSSIGLYFDPKIISHHKIKENVTALLRNLSHDREIIGDKVSIPVFYGEKYGPDLEYVAELLNLTPEQVIREHSTPTYTVYSIGFLPGFPYMGQLSKKIVIARKDSPALRVAAGSVAIAGNQTGIYPFESPGGWHIIGWTPLKIFDHNRINPALLRPGDKVSFVPAVPEK